MNAKKPNNTTKLFLACFASVYGIGYLSYMLSPIVIGSIVEGLGLTEREAGVVATVELFSLAICVVLLAPRMANIRRRQLALAGIVAVIVGHGTAAISAGFWSLLPARAAAGVGLGLLIAAGNATIAGSASPQRLFAAALTLGQLVAAVLLLFVLPWIDSHWSFHGTYGFLAIWAILLSPLIRWLPNQLPQDEVAVGSPDVKWRLFLLPTVIAMILIGGSDSSVWTFTERIAHSLGMDTQQTGTVLAAALVAGVAGSVLSATIGTRFGESGPILIGSIVLAASYFGVATAVSNEVYAASQIAVLALFGFLVPYLYGVNGRMDNQGRIMVAGSGAHLIGMGLGPVLAGQAVLAVGFGGIGILVAGSTITCATMFLIFLYRESKSELAATQKRIGDC